MLCQVTSLWGVPDSIRSQLAAAVCAKRKMSPEVALLFSENQPTELVLPDCTALDAAAMLQLLQLLVAAQDQQQQQQQQQQQEEEDQQQQQQQGRLQRLELGFCGRGFGDEAAAALAAAAGGLQQLSVLRLGGVYKLSDQGLLTVLRATQNLQELAVPSASKLTGQQ
jgi:DNA repair protein RAD7